MGEKLLTPEEAKTKIARKGQAYQTAPRWMFAHTENGDVIASTSFVTVTIPAARIEQLAPYVQDGAELLDEKFPGWHERINLEYLDLADCRFCICGQIGMALTKEAEGDVRSGRWRGTIDFQPIASYLGVYDRANELGFNVDIGRCWHSGSESVDYLALDVLWHRLITGRLDKEGNNG